MCMFSNKVVTYTILLLSVKGDDQMKLIKRNKVCFSWNDVLIFSNHLNVASNVNDLSVEDTPGISLEYCF